MRLEYQKIAAFVPAGVVYAAGSLLRTWSTNVNAQTVCSAYDSHGIVYCYSPFKTAFALTDLSQMLAVAAVILLITDSETFRKWLAFTFFYIPCAVILDLLFYPMNTGLWFMSGLPAGYEQGLYPFGRLFVLATLFIVLRGLYHAKKAKA